MVCPICLTSAVLANAPILAAGIAATTAAQRGRKMVMTRREQGYLDKSKSQNSKKSHQQQRKGEFDMRLNYND
jgi:hypothetical protein